MPATINADNGVVSGSAGVKTTADTSGVLALQSNGATGLTLGTDLVTTLAQPLPVGSGGTGATSLSGITVGTATSATTATNIAGGGAGRVPYNTGSGATAFTAAGTAGQVLTSAGTSAPTWSAAPSPVPEFVASGSIASAGLAVSLRSDGKVEVTTGTNPSASVGTPVSPNNSATTINRITSVYDPVNSKVVVAWAISGTGQAAVGTVSGSTISFGSSANFISESVDNLTASYDTANSKVVLVCRGNSNYLRAVVGTVSGTSISFGSVANQNDTIQHPRSVYDSVSGKVVIVASNYAASDSGNIYLATVSGTSISISYAGSLGNFVDQPTVVADTANQKIVVFFADTNNSSRGSAAVGTISGGSISFTGGRTVFDSTTSNNFYSLYLPSIGASVVINDGEVRLCTLSAGVPTFTASTIFSASNSEFASVVYNSGTGKIVIVYKENGTSTGKYASGTLSSSGVTLDTAVTWLNTNPQYVAAVYDPSSTKVVPAYVNGSSGNGFSVAIQVAGVVTNANTFIGFSQSSAADGATLKVATEANIDANQTGLTANSQYYVNFDGTLTTTVTAYPLAGTALSATRIQVATAPEFAPAATGSWIFIGSVSASSSSTVDLTGVDNTYDNYVIVGDQIQVSEVQLGMKIGIDGTFVDAGYSFHVTNTTPSSNSYVALAANNIDRTVVIPYTQQNAAFVLYFSGARAAVKKTMHWTGGSSVSTTDMRMAHGSAILNNTGLVTGFRFSASSGTIGQGNFQLYGIKN
jgi:hypothetical protein